MSDIESLGSILSKGKLPDFKKKKQKLALLTANWKYLVGERNAAHSVPTKLARGTLTISADSPAWASELSMTTESLLRRISGSTSEGLVTKVKIRARGGAPVEGVASTERGAVKEVAVNRELDEKTRRDINAIEDEEMRQALTRLARASKADEQNKQEDR